MTEYKLHGIHTIHTNAIAGLVDLRAGLQFTQQLTQEPQIWPLADPDTVHYKEFFFTLLHTYLLTIITNMAKV